MQTDEQSDQSLQCLSLAGRFYHECEFIVKSNLFQILK